MNKIIYLFFLFTSILLPQSVNKSSDSSDLITGLIIGSIIAIVSGIIGIIGGYLINKWNSKSQLEHYKRTSKDKQIDIWINELKNYVSQVISEGNQFIGDILELYVGSDHDLTYSDKHLEALKKFLNEIELLNLNLLILLADSGSEKELYDKMDEYTTLLKGLSNKITGRIQLKSQIIELEKKISKGSLERSLSKNTKKLKVDLLDLDNNIKKRTKKTDSLKSKIAELTKSIVIAKQQEKSSSK
jgi:hypothetical protein